MIDTMDITAANGVPFRVVYLPSDEPSRHFPAEHKDSNGRARVEFYDRRYPHTDDGQFIARYYAKTLADKPVGGLDLSGGIPEWRIDTKTLFLVWSWIMQKLIG